MSGMRFFCFFLFWDVRANVFGFKEGFLKLGVKSVAVTSDRTGSRGRESGLAGRSVRLCGV